MAVLLYILELGRRSCAGRLTGSGAQMWCQNRKWERSVEEEEEEDPATGQIGQIKTVI